jgi:hypothetical protein
VLCTNVVVEGRAVGSGGIGKVKGPPPRKELMILSWLASKGSGVERLWMYSSLDKRDLGTDPLVNQEKHRHRRAAVALWKMHGSLARDTSLRVSRATD